MKQYTGKLSFGYERIKSDSLEWFQYENIGKDIVLTTTTEEFSCVCPWSKQPDFATVRIRYIPNKRCIELKSLKMYVVSFRDVGIFHEHAVNRIFDDLVMLIEPKHLRVEMHYKNRGGFVTTSIREEDFTQTKASIVVPKPT